MKSNILLCMFVLMLLAPAQGATLRFLNTTNDGNTFLYSGSLQNNQQVESGDYVVMLDFAGLLSGQGPAGWAFSSANDVPGQPDNALIADAMFTYTGPTIVGAPGETSLGTFSVTTSTNGQQQGSYLFETTRTDGGNAGADVQQLGTITIAAGSNSDASAVPEPGAMLLVGGGLLAVGLGRKRTALART
jgi:hypothetical protein